MPRRLAPAPRLRNAARTRDDILASAVEAFARAGYDGVGVREIASGAGVTAMLVNRYFGSKETLFAEALAAAMAKPILLAPEAASAPSLSSHLARSLVTVTEPGAIPLAGFAIMLRSASSPRAAEIARVEIEKHHQRSMTTLLGGDRAAQRAAIALSIVAGVQVMRQMIGLSALTDVDPETLSSLLEPAFRALTQPAPAARPRARGKAK